MATLCCWPPDKMIRAVVGPFRQTNLVEQGRGLSVSLQSATPRKAATGP